MSNDDFLQKLTQKDPNANGDSVASTALADAVAGFIRDNIRRKSMARTILPIRNLGAKTLSGKAPPRSKRERMILRKQRELRVREMQMLMEHREGRISGKTLAVAFGFSEKDLELPSDGG